MKLVGGYSLWGDFFQETRAFFLSALLDGTRRQRLVLAVWPEISASRLFWVSQLRSLSVRLVFIRISPGASQ